MANKGSSGYIKRLYAPKYFAIHKKEHKYIVKQNPGRHSLQKSVALSLLISKLGLGSTMSESSKIIKSGQVKVNGNAVKDPKFPVGLNDSIEVDQSSHTIGINRKGHIEIVNDENPGSQVYKVVGKYKDKKNKIMLRLHDGRIIEGKKDVNVNDSVVLSGKGLSKVLKLGTGAKCRVIDGVHVSMLGTVKETIKGNMHKEQSVIVERKEGGDFETLVRNIIVVE